MEIARQQIEDKAACIEIIEAFLSQIQSRPLELESTELAVSKATSRRRTLPRHGAASERGRTASRQEARSQQEKKRRADHLPPDDHHNDGKHLLTAAKELEERQWKRCRVHPSRHAIPLSFALNPSLTLASISTAWIEHLERPARALYDFEGKTEFRELSGEAGDALEVLKEYITDGWSLVKDASIEIGFLPRVCYTFTPAPDLDISSSRFYSPKRERGASTSTITPKDSPRSPDTPNALDFNCTTIYLASMVEIDLQTASRPYTTSSVCLKRFRRVSLATGGRLALSPENPRRSDRGARFSRPPSPMRTISIPPEILSEIFAYYVYGCTPQNVRVDKDVDFLADCKDIERAPNLLLTVCHATAIAEPRLWAAVPLHLVGRASLRMVEP
ncbi:hypothetical protein BDZ89DRAFT_1128474 [Hymenopellis radicata]|nr:hypothetical protein BDZ89DRAFT_1128474 [Hymenopellis radicata]